MSIDRQARERCIELLQSLDAGSITNWQFEDQWPDESYDLAVTEIGHNLWLLYDDFPEKKLSSSEIGLTNLDVCRIVSFLLTDLEYQWPATEPKRWTWKSLFTFKKHDSESSKFEDFGSLSHWPFANQEELEVIGQKKPLSAHSN